MIEGFFGKRARIWSVEKMREDDEFARSLVCSFAET